MREREFPAIRIEKGIELDAKHNRAYSEANHFFDSIAGMEIGDSFKIAVTKYAACNSVRNAFKQRGWIGRMKCYGKIKDKWVMRFWRVA